MTELLAHADGAHLAGSLLYASQVVLAVGFIAWCVRARARARRG